jgi:hypothetical protein
LFAPLAEKKEHSLKLAAVIDRLKKVHGAGIVLRGDELTKKTA